MKSLPGLKRFIIIIFNVIYLLFFLCLTAPALINGPKGGVVLDFSREQGSTPPPF